MTQLSWMDLGDRERTRAGAVKFKRYSAADQKRDAGIELVYNHASTEWQRAAAARLQDVIRTHSTFTSDDIVEYLEEHGIVTGDNRAIAAILKGAEKAGQIETTDEWRATRRVKAHSRPKRVWRVVRARV